jgi:hypothetical protein
LGRRYELRKWGTVVLAKAGVELVVCAGVVKSLSAVVEDTRGECGRPHYVVDVVATRRTLPTAVVGIQPNFCFEVARFNSTGGAPGFGSVERRVGLENVLSRELSRSVLASPATAGFDLFTVRVQAICVLNVIEGIVVRFSVGEGPVGTAAVIAVTFDEVTPVEQSVMNSEPAQASVWHWVVTGQ